VPGINDGNLVGVGVGVGTTSGLITTLEGRGRGVELSVGVGIGVGEMVGVDEPPPLGTITAAEIENVMDVVALPEVEPVPVIVTVLVEVSVGVPEIIPVEESKLKPAGNVPEVIA
jgi:hypothetical protein